ncbi:MAG: hypothetical protein ACPGMS_05045, partial [Candidatus Thalassarchaeaceae archaeon]
MAARLQWFKRRLPPITKSKIIAMFLASIFLFSLAYIGIGYTVASQGISANPGCGMWASNTP